MERLNLVKRRNFLIKPSDLSSRFSSFLLDTSRPLRNDEEFQAYLQMDRTEMEDEIESAAFLEHGEYGEHLYGTKFESVQRVIQSGKMCVLDLVPEVKRDLNNVDLVTKCFLFRR